MNEKTDKLAEDLKHFETLRDQARSLIMATVDEKSIPRASYAPFVRESGCFYVYLSRLSEHTRELIDNPIVSVLLIEDEAAASQIFARKRLTYSCTARAIATTEAGYESILERLTSRFGNVMVLLQSLPDFLLFRLEPVSGRFITGFGRAYELQGKRMDELVHIGPEDIGAAPPNTDNHI